MVPSSNPRLTIEHAVAADLDAIADCWVELATDQRRHGSHVLPEANRRTMREILVTHRFVDGLLVARVDGVLAGFASFSVENGSLELDTTRGLLSNLYVRPAYRDRGIGTALLERVEDELEARGVETLRLEVMAANEAARRFYERAGYDRARVAMERSLGTSAKNDTHSREDG